MLPVSPRATAVLDVTDVTIQHNWLKLDPMDIFMHSNICSVLTKAPCFSQYHHYQRHHNCCWGRWYWLNLVSVRMNKCKISSYIFKDFFSYLHSIILHVCTMKNTSHVASLYHPVTVDQLMWKTIVHHIPRWREPSPTLCVICELSCCKMLIVCMRTDKLGA